MAREKLPSVRHGIRMPVQFRDASGGDFTFHITYNFGEGMKVIECFVSHDDVTTLKEGSLLRAILEDGCITISLLLQHGMTMAEVAERLGENRPEWGTTGNPCSPFGAITRAGAELENLAKEPA